MWFMDPIVPGWDATLSGFGSNLSFLVPFPLQRGLREGENTDDR